MEKLSRMEELEKENRDLKARLEMAYRADELIHKLERETLLGNLNTGTKQVYKDFKTYGKDPCTADNYALLQSHLQSVFRCLEMNGIKLG